MAIPPEVGAVFAAKTVRTFCYGFLAIVLPLTLSSLGMSAPALGVSVTLMLAGSALMTWAVRRPLERHGARSTLMALAALSVASAVILLWTRSRWMVVAAAILGNVAVNVFSLINPTKEDGWEYPQKVTTPNEIYDAMKKWVKDNGEKYRIKKLVPEKTEKTDKDKTEK